MRHCLCLHGLIAGALRSGRGMGAEGALQALTADAHAHTKCWYRRAVSQVPVMRESILHGQDWSKLAERQRKGVFGAGGWVAVAALWQGSHLRGCGWFGCVGSAAAGLRDRQFCHWPASGQRCTAYATVVNMCAPSHILRR